MPVTKDPKVSVVKRFNRPGCAWSILTAFIVSFPATIWCAFWTHLLYEAAKCGWNII